MEIEIRLEEMASTLRHDELNKVWVYAVTILQRATSAGPAKQMKQRKTRKLGFKGLGN